MTRLEIAARIAAGLATDATCSAKAIAEFSLQVADELIRLEAETRPKPEPEQELPFEMVVGGVYEMRNGEIEEIVAKVEDQTYPFDGKSGRAYTKIGSRLTSKQSPFDLIRRIK